ncbi:unnamed protein product, partial [Protopolystoma xenopodis]
MWLASCFSRSLVDVFQEILLCLLDHFKRIIHRSEGNKMTVHQLASCLAPVLLFPSPESARDLDPGILEPRTMTQMLQYILEIWPEARPTSESGSGFGFGFGFGAAHPPAAADLRGLRYSLGEATGRPVFATRTS